MTDDTPLGGHATASLWFVDWPTQDLEKDVVKNVMDYVTMQLKIVNMLLTHVIDMLMPLPSKDICLKVTKSKMQLIILICKCLQEWLEQLHKMEESL